MKTYGRRWRTCVRIAAGATAALTLCTAAALAQTPDQKMQQVYRTFYLKNATGQNAANDIQTTFRNMLPNERIYYAPSENALSVKGSAEDVAATEKILGEIDRQQKTYRVTYTISGGDNAGAAKMVLMVTPGSKAISKQGTRVPIMTGAYKAGEGESANTQFQYADIGLTIEASVTGFGDGIRLYSKIEQTSIADEKSNVGIQDPVIKQSVLQSQSAFAPGKPITIGSVEMPGGQRMQVQATVELAQ
jgi:type II secretory pathway component GspD/PulD (secretin)